MSARSVDEDAVLDRILSETASHYQVLGVASTATSVEVKKSYKALALRYHPDKYNGPHEARARRAFPRVNDAYVVLSDADERRKYDRELPALSSQGSSSSAHSWSSRWSQFTAGSGNSTSQAASSSERPTGPGPSNGNNSNSNSNSTSTSSSIAMATMLTGLVVGALAQNNSPFSSVGERDFHAHVASMMTFLRTVKEELDINDEFVLQAGEAIMRGFADVFVEILPYLISVASTVSPSLAWKLSAAAAVGAFFAKDKVFTMFDWRSMNPQMRGFVIDGLMHYYQTARRR